MIAAEVVIENKLWKKKIKKPTIYLNKKIKKISSLKLSKKKNLSFTILLTSDSKMKYLNTKFRKKKQTTDVLSFPFWTNEEYKKNKKNKIYLGDIALSYEIINQRAKDTNFDVEFDKMWVHGYLHLLGYNHKKVKDYKVMKKIEDKILKII